MAGAVQASSSRPMPAPPPATGSTLRCQTPPSSPAAPGARAPLHCWARRVAGRARHTPRPFPGSSSILARQTRAAKCRRRNCCGPKQQWLSTVPWPRAAAWTAASASEPAPPTCRSPAQEVVPALLAPHWLCLPHALACAPGRSFLPARAPVACRCTMEPSLPLLRFD